MSNKKILEMEVLVDKKATAMDTKIARVLSQNGLRILESNMTSHSPNRNLYKLTAETIRDFETLTMDKLVEVNTKLVKTQGVKNVDVAMFSHQATVKSGRE